MALILPIIILLAATVNFITKQEHFGVTLALSCLIMVVAISGFWAGLDIKNLNGGWLGYYLAMPLIKLFGFWVSVVFFGAAIIAAAVLFWWLLGQPLPSFSNTGSAKEKRR